MPVRVRFPSGAHQPLSGILREGFLFMMMGRDAFGRHEIGKNVSKSGVNGRFEHKIDQNVRAILNFNIPLGAECTVYDINV